jgi:hypothetical protein
MKTDHIHCLGSAAAAAEVRSSADQCVRSHIAQNVAGSAVRSNVTEARSNVHCTAYLEQRRALARRGVSG